MSNDRYENIRKALEMLAEHAGAGEIAQAIRTATTIRELLAERDRLAAALEAARGDGWQPIETAPNEGWFLVHSDRGWIGLARRSDPDYAPDEGWFEDEHTEFLDPAWLTHWHPLPAPPAIDQALGKGGKEDGND